MTKCNIVYVKFKSYNQPAEEIRAPQITACKYLVAHVEHGFLLVDYKNEAQDTLKRIAYSLENIREYACEGVIR